MEKQKVPDIPIVPYTTCEQYREYMGGIPDDNSTIKHNPIPEDAMKLYDLGKMTKAEILEIVNEMGQCENKSDIRVMYSHGYGFTWTQLTTVAEFVGFKNETPDKRKVVYSNPESDNKLSEAEYGVIEVLRTPHAYTVEKKLYLSKSTANKLKKITTKSTGKAYSNSTKSRILSAIVEDAVNKCYELKNNGRLKIVIKEEEL